MRRGMWALGVVAVSLGGCIAHSDVVYVPVAAPPRPVSPRTAEQVEAFVGTPPARPHVDIGLLQVISRDPFLPDPGHIQTGNIQIMMLELRRAAGLRGCDAVLITTLDARHGPYSNGTIEGSCEVYTDVRAEVAAPPVALGTLVTIVSDGADIRDAPSFKAPVITRLDGGARALVVLAPAGWGSLKLADGRVGYVSDATFFQDF